jgi:hypothetical protein
VNLSAEHERVLCVVLKLVAGAIGHSDDAEALKQLEQLLKTPG